jgi:hypothetical protein
MLAHVASDGETDLSRITAMRALTVAPGTANSAQMEDVADPPLSDGTASGHDFDIDVGALNLTMVLDNDTVFGTVNANRRHYEMASEALQRADKAWLHRLITRREPVEQWTQALERLPDDIKVIVDFS